MDKNIQIIKASGQIERFDVEKVALSLQKAGTEKQLAENIAKEVEKRVRNRMTTNEIYRLAFSLLKEKEKSLAARYSLKKAIFQLGPKGYPFEKFIGKLLERRGYQVQVGQIVQGKCVKHEIDVIAEKEGEHLLVECKFHNDQGIRSDVKIALYVKSRFDDVQAGLHLAHKDVFHQIWLVTNTKVTEDAAQYARCEGVKVIAWNYPRGESLQEIIESSGLHPLTCLPALSLKQKQEILSRGVVLCRELAENPDILSQIGIKEFKKQQIISDIYQICP